MDNLKMTLDELLSKWGLDREVIEKFLNNKIQINQLNKLTPKDLKKLIPKIGDRIQFQTAMEKNYHELQYEATAQCQLRDSQFKRKRLVDQLVENESEDHKFRLLKKANVQLLPTNEELKNCIIGILDKVNLDTTSMKAMFNLVFAEYPLLDLSFKKDFIRKTVNSLLSRPVNSAQAMTTHNQGSHVEWKLNAIGGGDNKTSKKSLYKKTSDRQSNKNNPKKKEFVRRILKSDPVLRSILLEKVKESFEPCISSLLYAENIELIVTMKLNLKEGGYYCPLCSRFMTPQYKWNSSKDSITWDVSNFRRHLLFFHSDQPSSSDDGSKSDPSDDNENQKIESPVVGVDSIKSIKTEPADLVPLINFIGQGYRKLPILDAIQTIDSVIVLSDDNESDENQEIESQLNRNVVGVDSIKSIETEPAHSVPLLNFIGQGNSISSNDDSPKSDSAVCETGLETNLESKRLESKSDSKSELEQQKEDIQTKTTTKSVKKQLTTRSGRLVKSIHRLDK